ncbi:MAG: phosphatase domain-containing protein [Candidatus Nanopelagicales bacterium]
MKLPKVPELSRLVRMVSAADRAVNAGMIEIKRRRQSLRPIEVVPYRGWYSEGVAHLTARCIEKPLFSASTPSAGMGQALRANLRRFTVLTMPGVTVHASLGPASQEFTSDDGGYLHISLEVGPLLPGWHVLDIDPTRPGAVPHTTGRVFVPDPRNDLVVVSDIDDTILKTGLTQRWTAAGRTFLRDVADRKPVPGMATFYAGLSHAEGPGRTVPFYYVSTGSWNYYDYLVAFLNLHRFPRGPLFLTDWGPDSQRLMRDGREHKRTAIRSLVAAHPGASFVLVGDVGQGDPETYEVIAREYPDQVRAIFLVYVGSHLAQRSAEVTARAARLREEEGIPMYYVANAVEAVTVAWQLGLVDNATTTAIAKEFSQG